MSVLAAAGILTTLVRSPGPTDSDSEPHGALLFSPSAEGSTEQYPLSAACARGMRLVEGRYCTTVVQECLRWMEPPTAGGEIGRCALFATSTCTGDRTAMRFCIDIDEYTRDGEVLPANRLSWTDAERLCAAEGKRLCLEREWNFACEGEASLPYPTGYARDASKCNIDCDGILDPRGVPRDLRRPSSELADCVSPFGARNMVGNVDEWTLRDVSGGRWRGALKGGWWLGGRNRCRPATTAHDEAYKDFQTGTRCCADAS